MLKDGLKCGILDHHEYHDSYIGVPQGGIASPIIFNIYMHEFDKFIITELIPKYQSQNSSESQIKEVTEEWSLLNSRTKHVQSRINKDEEYFNSKERFPNFPTTFAVSINNADSFLNLPFRKKRS